LSLGFLEIRRLVTPTNAANGNTADHGDDKNAKENMWCGEIAKIKTVCSTAGRRRAA
jgi:hypothetical protein